MHLWLKDWIWRSSNSKHILENSAIYLAKPACTVKYIVLLMHPPFAKTDQAKFLRQRKEAPWSSYEETAC